MEDRVKPAARVTVPILRVCGSLQLRCIWWMRPGALSGVGRISRCFSVYQFDSGLTYYWEVCYVGIYE